MQAKIVVVVFFFHLDVLKSTTESRFLEPSISRSSRQLEDPEPKVVSLDFASLSQTLHAILPTLDFSNQFSFPLVRSRTTVQTPNMGIVSRGDSTNYDMG